MKGNKKEAFKDICKEEYIELKKVVSEAAKKRNCSITLGSKKVLVVAEDPHNVSGTIKYKLDYTSSIVDDIYGIFNELDSILQTFYGPLYMAMLPTIVSSLGDSIRELTHDEYEVVVVYVDGRESEPFKYNATDYAKFVDHITDLIVSTNAVLAVPDQSPCKNHKEHCGKCGNSNCQHNTGLIKSLWCNLDPKAQLRIKQNISAEDLAELEKAIG